MHHAADMGHRQLDIGLGQVGKDRMSQEKVVTLRIRKGQFAAAVDEQPRALFGDPLGKDKPAGGVDSRWRQVETGIPAGLEIRYEMSAGAKRATADVEQGVVRLQTVRDEIVELKSADFLPHTADCSLIIVAHPHVAMPSIGIEIIMACV